MYNIGIDLGGTNIAVGLCDNSLHMLDKGTTRTLAYRDGEEIVKDMATLARTIVERNSISLDEIAFVGIATPGIANEQTGEVEYCCNLPFVDFPIVRLFRKYFPTEHVRITNDANAAALGEALAGSAKGTKSSVMVSLGTGVGGGIIIDGKIYHGGLNFAGGELGHTVIQHGGRLCGCGRRGCWEAYSSATALSNTTKETMEELRRKRIDSLLFSVAEKDGKVNARTAFKAMKAGDEWARRIVDEYVSYLAVGITNMINVFQPEVLSIGGGISGEKEYLTRPLTEIVEREQYTRFSKIKTRVVAATLGNDAGIIGAAGLGFQFP